MQASFIGTHRNCSLGKSLFGAGRSAEASPRVRSRKSSCLPKSRRRLWCACTSSTYAGSWLQISTPVRSCTLAGRAKRRAGALCCVLQCWTSSGGRRLDWKPKSAPVRVTGAGGQRPALISCGRIDHRTGLSRETGASGIVPRELLGGSHSTLLQPCMLARFCLVRSERKTPGPLLGAEPLILRKCVWYSVRRWLFATWHWSLRFGHG